MVGRNGVERVRLPRVARDAGRDLPRHHACCAAHRPAGHVQLGTWPHRRLRPRLGRRGAPQVVGRARLEPLVSLGMPVSMDPEPEPLASTGAIAACSWGPNRLDVFTRAVDGNLYHAWWDGSWTH